MKKSLIIFVIFILTLFFFMQCNTPSSSSGGGGSGNSDDTGETSFKRTVDSTGNVGRYTSIAVDGSIVYISYFDYTNYDLKFARSTDGGKTWDPGNIKTVDSAGDVGRYTSIAVDGLNIYISYYDFTNGNLKFAKSTDGGNTWDPGNIKTVDSAGYVGMYTSITVDDFSNVYISYHDDTNYDLKFVKSTDGGNTWGAGNIKIVDSADDVGEWTSIAVDGSIVYISYCDYTNGDLKFAKSTDGGDTWRPSEKITVDYTGDVGRYTSIAVDGLNVYISYYDYSYGNLKFAKSTDGGNTWSAGNIKIVDSAGYDYTSIAVDGSNVYISYYSDVYGDLKFIKSTDGGNTWDPGNIKIVDSVWDVGFFSSIALKGSDVYISYYNLTYGDLKFARSVDRGDTW